MMETARRDRFHYAPELLEGVSGPSEAFGRASVLRTNWITGRMRTIGSIELCPRDLIKNLELTLRRIIH